MLEIYSHLSVSVVNINNEFIDWAEGGLVCRVCKNEVSAILMLHIVPALNTAQHRCVPLPLFSNSVKRVIGQGDRQSRMRIYYNI